MTAAEQPAPRTAAGRRLFGTISHDHAFRERWLADILAIEAEAANDAFQKGEAAITALLDKQAAAGQPPPDEAVRRFAKALTEYGTHHGNCPYESWNKRLTRCKCGLFALIKEANAALASPPPTAAPPEDWSEIQHPGYGEGAAPERVSGDKESHPVPPMEAGAAISPSTVSDQHSAPERVGSAPPAVSGLDVERLARAIHADVSDDDCDGTCGRAEQIAAEYARLAPPTARFGSAEASDKDE